MNDNEIVDVLEEYRELLNGVGPKAKELILSKAQNDKRMTLKAFVFLCKLAYPDEA